MYTGACVRKNLRNPAMFFLVSSVYICTHKYDFGALSSGPLLLRYIAIYLNTSLCMYAASQSVR